MDIFKIAGIGIIACLLSIYISKDNKTISIMISLCAGIFIIYIGIQYLAPFINVISDMNYASIISESQLKIVMKIIITAYIAQFAADICDDAGQKSLATKIEMSGKFIIIYLSLPVLLSLFDYLSSLI